MALVIIIQLLYMSACTYGTFTAEMRLHEALLGEYNTDIRPYAGDNSSIDLNITFSPLYLSDVLQREQLVEMFGWLRQSWYDDRLAWTPKQYGGIKKIYLNANKVWIPDLTIINAHHPNEGLFDYAIYRLVVEHTGKVMLVTSGLVRTICILDVRFYPFDEHICHIEFDAWTLDASELSVNEAEINMFMFRVNGEWDIINQWVHKAVIDDTGDSGWFTTSFVFHFQRKPLAVMISTVLPCIVIGHLHLFMYLIPFEEGERVSFGVTLMLSFTVFQIYLKGELPDTAEFMPIIDVYLSCVMYLVAVSLAGSIVIINLYRKSGPTPAWITQCFVKSDGDPITWKRAAMTFDRILLGLITTITLAVTAVLLSISILSPHQTDYPLAGYGYHKSCKVCYPV